MTIVNIMLGTRCRISYMADAFVSCDEPVNGACVGDDVIAAWGKVSFRRHGVKLVSLAICLSMRPLELVHVKCGMMFRSITYKGPPHISIIGQFLAHKGNLRLQFGIWLDARHVCNLIHRAFGCFFKNTTLRIFWGHLRNRFTEPYEHSSMAPLSAKCMRTLVHAWVAWLKQVATKVMVWIRVMAWL